MQAKGSGGNDVAGLLGAWQGCGVGVQESVAMPSSHFVFVVFQALVVCASAADAVRRYWLRACIPIIVVFGAALMAFIVSGGRGILRKRRGRPGDAHGASGASGASGVREVCLPHVYHNGYHDGYQSAGDARYTDAFTRSGTGAGGVPTSSLVEGGVT